MAVRIYDSQNLEKIQLKMAWSKKICPRSIPHKMFYNYILLKVI